MERTQIYLTQEQKEALIKLGNEKAATMAELIREAIDAFLIGHRRQDRQEIIQGTFGAFPEWQDGEAYTRRLRSGWQKRSHAAAEEGEPYCPT